jgi:hypothetical protein
MMDWREKRKKILFSLPDIIVAQIMERRTEWENRRVYPKEWSMNPEESQ